MIKKMLLVAVTMLVSGSMLAQTKSSVEEEFVTYETDKYKVETNKFWSNWFISVGGGAQMLFGDHEKQMKFADRLSPALDVAIGKWFTPGIGIRFMYSGLSWKGVTQNGAYGNGKVYDASKYLEEQEANYFNLHGDVLFNLSNLFCGYNEKRIWNVSPYVSLGWARMLDAPKTNEITGSLGLINSFRLCSSLDLQIDVRGTVMNDRFVVAAVKVSFLQLWA